MIVNGKIVSCGPPDGVMFKDKQGRPIRYRKRKPCDEIKNVRWSKNFFNKSENSYRIHASNAKKRFQLFVCFSNTRQSIVVEIYCKGGRTYKETIEIKGFAYTFEALKVEAIRELNRVRSLYMN